MAVKIFFVLAHILVKTSILLQYLRFCIMPAEQRVCYGTLAFVIAGGIASMLILTIACIPVEALWSLNPVGARCINSTATFYATSIYTILTDVAVLIIPMFLLRHSSLRWYKKLAVGGALGLGGL